MSTGKDEAAEEKPPEGHKESQSLRWRFWARPYAFLDPIRSLFEPPQRLIAPFVKNGMVVVDLGSGSGYYTLPLADLVGPEGKVYAVDLDKKCIRALQSKAAKGGYHNIEAYTSSASDVSFIKDRSVDFVFAYGLLCSMADNRQSAVNEIKRILKSTGQAYISLGFPPPLGFVDQAEWEKILAGFKVERGGSFKELFAVVSLKHESINDG